MIAQGAPRVIHNDAELEAYTDALFQLTSLEHPSLSEAEAIELLTLLVERYEQTRYTTPAAVISPFRGRPPLNVAYQTAYGRMLHGKMASRSRLIKYPQLR